MFRLFAPVQLVDDEIDQLQQEIRFNNSILIAFGAREHGFGRGLHGADVEVFDEAQILTVRALDNLVPVINTAPDQLVVFLGNPPMPGDPSEVFADKRANALAGVAGVAYAELSTEPGCDLDDRGQWARANPSYPKRTSEQSILRLRKTPLPILDTHHTLQSILRLRKTLAEDAFRREALGVWDTDTVLAAIGEDEWAHGNVQEPNMDGRVSFGVDMPPDRPMLSIAVAIKHDQGGTAMVNLQEYADVRAQGTAWAVDWLADKWTKASAIVIDSMSPAMSIVPDLVKRHVHVTVTNARDLLVELVAALVDSYGDIAATAASEWYMQVRARNTGDTRYRGMLGEGFPSQAVQDSIRWKAGVLWDDPEMMYRFLHNAIDR
ncbi:hypothetical protein [Bifidobacterium gallicum]|uniref:Phage-related terminase n=1 Tax=Bifidobacterium gallicum DSM 20093 = LMG 11596 TaxID=561180 RepID=D1NSM6_9BIFI|nr:hypothetical protein [Bifidobacterium gallicum]EFA23678.1 hypothetical protein BIFGAL_02785 [Bifidobacterium gallicum DSM 20093 = LMG 11596]KFI58737.1 phage-related terminase [Bifidobacterium gallicum DSM 20093 = LMG 11596]